MILGIYFCPYYLFNPLTEAVSALAMGGGNIIFNTGLKISGILAILGFFILFKETTKIGTILGIIGGLGLAGIGFFPGYSFSYHFFFSYLYFLSPLAAIGVVCFSNNSNKIFSTITQKLGYIITIGLVFSFILFYFNAVLGEWLLYILPPIWSLLLGIDVLKELKITKTMRSKKKNL